MRHRGIDLKLTGSVSRGYKSGGFNTQIFSDILQNRMMNGMMSELGVYLDAAEEIPASSTSYRPESCMDYEAGLRLGINAAGHFLTASATAYHISCRNQQITVFPRGKGTGRMMANAAKSRSRGVESELSWRWKGLNVNFSASFMDARFVSYDDGHEDYSGNRIPYSPSSSLYARAGYRFDFNSKVLNSLMLSADILWNGIQAKAVAAAFEQLSYKEQWYLEKRNAICMTCGRVSPLSTQSTFEDLAVDFEGTTASGAERFYRRTLDKLRLKLLESRLVHTVTLKQTECRKRNKK